jgi:hypothetical protein
MDQEKTDNINRQVFRQFPYMKGTEPETKQQENGNSLLIYKSSAVTADGHAFPVIVRVVIDSSGKILKITSTR